MLNWLLDVSDWQVNWLYRRCITVVQRHIPLSSLKSADDADIDVTNFDAVLESTLTWLLEAEDVLSMQGPVSDRVTTVKEQFQQHEVSVMRVLSWTQVSVTSHY